MDYDLISKDTVPRIWPIIEKWVETAQGVDKSYKNEDILRMCESGQVDLWLISENGEYFGFLIGNTIVLPRQKIYYAPWLGGRDLGKWVKEGTEVIKEYARRKGCKAYSWVGRKAWEKLLDLDADYTGVFYFINI